MGIVVRTRRFPQGSEKQRNPTGDRKKKNQKAPFQSPLKVIRPPSLSSGEPGARPAPLQAVMILRFIALALVTGTVGLRGTRGVSLSYF